MIHFLDFRFFSKVACFFTEKPRKHRMDCSPRIPEARDTGGGPLTGPWGLNTDVPATESWTHSCDLDLAPLKTIGPRNTTH